MQNKKKTFSDLKKCVWLTDKNPIKLMENSSVSVYKVNCNS